VLERILDQVVARGATPGGVLIAADQGAVTHHIAFGTTSAEPDGSGVPVTAETLYDLASLTKPIATVGSVMKLVDSGALDLEDPVRKWIPELTGEATSEIEVRDLLTHSSGLPAHLKFYERILAGETLDARSPRETLLRMVASTPIEYERNTQSVYSDLGFILLGFVVERATGERLDRVAQRLVFDPVGMAGARFVDLEQTDRPAHAAPTERCPYRGLVVGEVHDQNCHAAGGIMGHAGLFAAADDVARFADAMVKATAGFDASIIEMFGARCDVPDSTRTLGWDTPSSTPGESHAGELFSRASFGHLGFTGTALWIDRAHGRFVALIANSIHPAVQRPVTKAMRRDVMDAVVRELDS